MKGNSPALVPAHIADQGLLELVVPYELVVWAEPVNETVYVEDFGVRAAGAATVAEKMMTRDLDVLKGR